MIGTVESAFIGDLWSRRLLTATYTSVLRFGSYTRATVVFFKVSEAFR